MKLVNTLGALHIDHDTTTVPFPKRAHNPLPLEVGLRRGAVRLPSPHDCILRFVFSPLQ